MGYISCFRFSYIFWVDASSHESITTSLKGLSSISTAQAFGVDGSVESVLSWISYITEEWLIVFDNAANPSPEVVAKFIPPGNGGNILITSRNRSMGRVVSSENIIEIDEMEESDAVSLLLKASHMDGLLEEDAKRLVVELGCIPLAVEHAGAYIHAGNSSISDYLRQFSLHRKDLMSDDIFRGASNYNQTVYGTWDLSLKEIKKRADGQSGVENMQAAEAAILILHICAFYHHNNISKDIFRSAAEESQKYVVGGEVANKLPQAINSLPVNCSLLTLDNNGHWDDFFFGKGVIVLLSFSLMKREKTAETLSFHPLVHSWSREQLPLYEQQRMYEMGSIILSCAIARRFTSYDYALRRLIFPHIKANELYGDQMRLEKKFYDDKYDNFALVMSENGDWKNAEQFQVQVMDMRKKLLGPEHLDTLMSMDKLACTYINQGKWNEAEELTAHVIDMKKNLLGPDNPHTITSMGNMAIIYSKQGKWNEAEQLQVQVMDMSEELLGLYTITDIESLARIYSNQGKWNEAEQMEIQAMDMRKKLQGPEHPDTMMSMGNLANTYNSQGKWNKAEQLEVQVMDMRKKLLGLEHPDTLLSMANLASTYRDQGKWNEAEKLQVQVMDMRKKLLSLEHPDTLMNMANLACTYSNQGRWNEAEQLEVQVMDMRKKLLGPEHPDTMMSMANLANTYNSQRKLNKAEQLEVQVMNMRKKLLGLEHPDTLKSMGNLASTYRDQGKWNEAEQLELQVIDMRKKLLGLEHPDTIMCMGNLASTYSYQRKWNEAEQLQVQVMDMIKKLLGPKHPNTLICMGNLASIYSGQGKWNEAEQLQVQLMDMIKELFGPEHPHTLICMGNLAVIYHNQEKWDEAEQLLAQVMNIRNGLRRE